MSKEFQTDDFMLFIHIDSTVKQQDIFNKTLQHSTVLFL